uniref:Uncharacterized protein n=1 Tax=Arundo donax TaxID=35708 RepID=A0A0A8YSG6_ARUDO
MFITILKDGRGRHCSNVTTHEISNEIRSTYVSHTQFTAKMVTKLKNSNRTANLQYINILQFRET